MKRTLYNVVAAVSVAIGLVACGGAPTPTPTPEPAPFIALQTGQAASIVIGQDDFTASAAHPDNDKRFQSVYGSALILDGTLYLPDDGSGRVMGYTSVPATNGVAADFVLGKIDFAGGDGGSAQRLNQPGSVFTDGEHVFVSDYDLNRIVRYSGTPTTSGAAADLAIGQPDLDSTGDGCSATALFGPDGAIIAGGKLIVADSSNYRILIWNTVPTTFNEPADIVLGQVDRNSCDSPPAGPTDRNFESPRDIWSDGSRLLVVDDGFHRVLGWNTFPTEHNASADFVLGQPGFSTDDTGDGASEFYNPSYIESNGTQVFVSDSNNNRVLVWNEFPSENAQPADLVLGQSGFGMGSVNSGQSGANATGFYTPTGLYAYENMLFVGDLSNHRYLVFEGQ